MLTKRAKLACPPRQSLTSYAFAVPASHNKLRLGLLHPSKSTITLSPFLATLYDFGQDLTVYDGAQPVQEGTWLQSPSSSLVRCLGIFEYSTHFSGFTKELFTCPTVSINCRSRGLERCLCIKPLTLRCSSACTSQATSWAPRRPLIGQKPQY
jgi:hypothetical protein